MTARLLLVLLLAAACRPAPPRCTPADFTALAGEYMIDDIRQPFVIRQMAGRVLTQEGDGWPTGFPILFQVHGRRGLSRSLEVHPDGTFQANDLGPGEYCFKVATAHTRTYLGRIIVDRRAPASQTFELRLKWGD
ncbi:MAG TPA: hypothetical protein VJ276_06790 [Thermoanaerobaculia bacterium]|nr:hypothetical protein [Thermoanaerobaculia bacterium]